MGCKAKGPKAQAEFVYWWDNQANRAKEGRPRNSDRSAAVSRLGKDGLPDEHVVRRWRNKLNDPDKFEQTYEAACAKFAKILEFEKGAHVEHNSGENEVDLTPERMICGGHDQRLT